MEWQGMTDDGANGGKAGGADRETRRQYPPAGYRALRMCVNFRAGATLPSCGARGSRELADEAERQAAERDLPIELERVHCLGQCHIGPTMRLVPAGPYIMGARNSADVTRILDLIESGEFDKAAEEFPLPKRP